MWPLGDLHCCLERYQHLYRTMCVTSSPSSTVSLLWAVPAPYRCTLQHSDASQNSDTGPAQTPHHSIWSMDVASCGSQQALCSLSPLLPLISPDAGVLSV